MTTPSSPMLCKDCRHPLAECTCFEQSRLQIEALAPWKPKDFRQLAHAALASLHEYAGRGYMCDPVPAVEISERAKELGNHIAALNTALEAEAFRIQALEDIAHGVLAALSYPRGSEAQVRCLEEVGQDARAVIKTL